MTTECSDVKRELDQVRAALVEKEAEQKEQKERMAAALVPQP